MEFGASAYVIICVYKHYYCERTTDVNKQFSCSRNCRAGVEASVISSLGFFSNV